MASAHLTGAFSDSLLTAASRPNPLMPKAGNGPNPLLPQAGSGPNPLLPQANSDMVSFLRGEDTKPEYGTVKGKWICSSCGTANQGRFCTQCGKKRPGT